MIGITNYVPVCQTYRGSFVRARHIIYHFPKPCSYIYFNHNTDIGFLSIHAIAVVTMTVPLMYLRIPSETSGFSTIQVVVPIAF